MSFNDYYEKKQQNHLQGKAVNVSQQKQKQEQIRSKVQSDEVERNLREIADRDQAIDELYGKMVDLNELFKDVQSLAQFQSEQLTSIETCVTNSLHNTDEAIIQLEKAQHSQPPPFFGLFSWN